MLRETTKKCISVMMLSSLMLGLMSCERPPELAETTNDEYRDDENYITCLVFDRGDLPDGASFDDNNLANWIRESVKKECGVEVHYVSVPRSTADDEIMKMIDKGNAPDIIFTYSASVYGYMTRQGKVADLTDSYKEYGTNIKEYIGDIQSMGRYNNKQVAIMKRRGFQTPRHVAYIRKDWCDALSMEVPRTKEELIAFLYAVKDKNPGNVEGLVPWAFSGDTYSEKAYQSFVSSYIDELSDRDAYIYSEKYIVLMEDAREGLKKLNELYNDGIISLDFTADKESMVYDEVVRNGKTAFVVEDNTAPFEYISHIKEVSSGAEFDPVLCFDLPGGGYRNVTEPLYGMYVMVPEVSKSKADSVMKYLNWLADPENAEKVLFTPGYEETSNGAPKKMTQEEYNAAGYPGTPGDYCIINEHFEYMDDIEAQVDTWSEGCDWEDREWFENLYNICTTDQYAFPSAGQISEAEANNGNDYDKMIVEYVYNAISAPRDEFDELIDMDMIKLMESGVGDILDERAAFYDEGKVTPVDEKLEKIGISH